MQRAKNRLKKPIFRFFILTLTLMSSTFLMSLKGWASDSYVLDEAQLVNQLGVSSPEYLRNEADQLSAELENAQAKEALGASFNASSQHYKSKERLLNNFDGAVTAESRIYQLGITQPLKYGAAVSVGAFQGRSTNAFISEAAYTGMSVGLSLDLFQDFFGRQTRSILKSTDLRKKRSEWEKTHGLKLFEVQVRKVFWSLVAIEEKSKLLNSLVGLAEKQLNEAKKRFRAQVGDSGEIARYQSQLADRKASLLSLIYQRGEAHKQLKKLVPGLIGKKLTMGQYQVPRIVEKVLVCSGQIRSFGQAPLDYTYYDQIIDSLRQEQEFQARVDSTHSDPDVKLKGEYASVGRDFGLENSRSNFEDDGRDRTSVMLELTIPLGGKSKKVERIRKKLNQKRYNYQIENALAQIRSYHEETAKNIGILNDVVQNRKLTNSSLTTSLKVSERKFKQARLNLQSLISERDALLQSQLSEIDTNLTIINTLLDYFGLFPQFPCEFNQVTASTTNAVSNEKI